MLCYMQHRKLYHKINFHIKCQLEAKNKESPRNLTSVLCLLRNLMRKFLTWTITLSPGPLYTWCVCFGTYVKVNGWHSLWKFHLIEKNHMCVCTCAPHMPSKCVKVRRELYLTVVFCHIVDTGDWTSAIGSASRCPHLMNHHVVPTPQLLRQILSPRSPLCLTDGLGIYWLS